MKVGIMVIQDRKESYLKSNFFEQMVEHVFISEILQEAWFRYGEIVDVLRSEIDSSGYDIVLECNGFIRHIQLKTSFINAKRSNQNVNVALAKKPSGCIIWLFREEDVSTNRIKLSFGFFGGPPDSPLPSLESYKTAKHNKGNAQGFKSERPSIKLVPKADFIKVPEITELLRILFGLGGKGL